MTFASADEIRHDVAEMVKPAVRVTVAEAAARDLRVANPSGGAGEWSEDVTPYMIEPMNLQVSRAFEAVVFVGPARSGKTIALVEGSIAHTVTSDPADMMVIQSNKDQAEDYGKARLHRTIHFSPELKQRLSPRAHDDNVLMKKFRSGMLLRIGWPSLAQLSGKDIKRMLMTDVDNATGDLSIDETFGLSLKRTQTFMSAGSLTAESNPARDYTDAKWKATHPHDAPPVDGILSLYMRGDRRMFYWPCLECRGRICAAPGLGLFNLPPTKELLERVLVEDSRAMARQYSIIACPHCGAALEHRHKREMNAGGAWLPQGMHFNPDGSISGVRRDTRTASFWLGGVAAAYQSWESLLEREFQAMYQYASTGESQPLKTTRNVDQAMPFVPMILGDDRDPDQMRDRSEHWGLDCVPHGVRFLTATIDIQANRFVVLVMGWGPSEDGKGLERWIIDWYSLKSSTREDGSGGFLPLDPAAYLEDWDRLIEKVIQRRYLLDDDSDRSMPIRFVALDSQGVEGTAPRALEFWRRLRREGLHHRVRLLKGEGGKSQSIVRETYPDSSKRNDRKSGSAGDVPMLILNTDRLKDMVSANLRRSEPGPGYYHCPSTLPESFFRELSSEVRTKDGWRNTKKKRNEAFDLSGYNEAVAIFIKAAQINFERAPPWAAEWDSNPYVIHVDDVKATTVRKPVIRQRPRVIRSKYLGR